MRIICNLAVQIFSFNRIEGCVDATQFIDRCCILVSGARESVQPPWCAQVSVDGHVDCCRC